MTAPNPPRNSLWAVLEKCKPNNSNFHDWSRNLRIVLKQERIEYVLNTRVPSRPNDAATNREREAYKSTSLML
ncbi:hypothetical protein LIER_25030 [Lithospermum erythrorhizon]|uniref:Retrotransposon Copia-like N-terminal domain-containing protein n=1 Tax=Lithospermum erythrorhizon TaxID=34254 RepID=A0AAV3R347_LITER